MTSPERAWFVTRLAEIPSSPLTTTGVHDDGAGSAECRRIGFEIHRLCGIEGMVEVLRAYRVSLGHEAAAGIARAWIGIGMWQG